MFTAVPQKNCQAAKTYFEEHLSHNDYYMQGEVEIGRWLGMGGERLGLLEGRPVDREAFMALCDNVHPETGERLTQRQNQEGDRRVFFDFTCSAPKSVSLMAVTMNDERLLWAHQEAARFAAKELEPFAATRIRINGADEDRRTGNLIGAEFLHNSSRALDPQLHTHFTFFNATFDSVEQRWKALQTSDLFAISQYGTEVYRNELVRRLHEIGYSVQPTATGFDIEGVEPELIRRFSKRSQERDKVVAEMEQRLERKLTNNEVSIAVHQTRSRKLKGITTEEVRERQLAQLSPDEQAELEAVKVRADGFRHNVTWPPLNELLSLTPTRERAALDLASAHVFERASVVSREELLRQALIAGRGHLDLAELKTQLTTDPDLIQLGPASRQPGPASRQLGPASSQLGPASRWSTREILATELYLVQTLNAGKDSYPALCPHFQPASHLGPDQHQALTHVLTSPDQFTGMRGLAGTGKTTTLSELSRALQESGRAALFCAPTAAATEVLRKDGFPAVTLAKLLKEDSLKPHSVVVLDEAGLVGITEMKELFELVGQSGSRVVFSGDTGQHASVSRGDALRILEDHSRYSFRELTTIRRQQAEDYRHVVENAAAERPQAAFDALDRLGWVHASVTPDPTTLYDSAATAYLESRAHGKSALLIAPTWAEIESVTAAVRQQLKKSGGLGAEEVSVPIFDSLSWTEAHKRQINRYSRGQRILFGQDSGSFRQHEQLEVVAVDRKKNALQVRREDGSTHLFRPRTGTSFDVGEARQIGVAEGDLLLLQGNRPKEGFINGQVGTVRSVENQRDAGPKITLTNGRVLPSHYCQFTHGYCVTSHSAQARTVDAVMLVASSRSAAAIHQEQFYVSISRGRQECQIFTDDKELLRSRIARSTQRQSALDLLGEALAAEGFYPPSLAAPEPLQAPPDARFRPLPNLHHLAERLPVPVHQFMSTLSSTSQARERMDEMDFPNQKTKVSTATPQPEPTPPQPERSKPRRFTMGF